MSGLRLVLARHGRTLSNVHRILDSALPGPPLDELGLVQADELGERLAGDPVSAVHASRALRAQQTAAPVAAAHGLAVDVLDGVHEVFCGDMEGRNDARAREVFEDVYAAWTHGDLDARIPGGESALDLWARFLPVVAAVTQAARDTVVLVSHGAAIRVAATALLGDAPEARYLGNTGLVILRPSPDAATGWELEHWDEAPPVRGDVTAGGAPE